MSIGLLGDCLLYFKTIYIFTDMTIINNLVILSSIPADRYEYFALKRDAYMDSGKMVMPVKKYLKHLTVLLDAKENIETFNPKTK